MHPPGAHELALVFEEPTRGRRAGELTGVWEVGVWTQDDLWLPVGVDGIKVVGVPPLDTGSSEVERFPGHPWNLARPTQTEGEGFEPSSEESPPKRFSRPPHSTALPP